MVNVGIIGFGHWGPNLARNIATCPDLKLHSICDLRPERLGQAGIQFPGVRCTTEFHKILEDSEIQAIAIASPVQFHYEMARAALEAGKHVLVEKPLAQTSVHCHKLIEQATREERVLMVGHVFLYNTAVRKVKEYIQSGVLGEVYYVYSQRLNLGIVRQDVNALWNFGPHDVSILCYWMDAAPSKVVARGYSYLQPGIDDVVFMTLDFPRGVGASVHISWLDPTKVRRMTVVGSEKMVVYDDVSNDAKIMLFDKAVTKSSKTGCMGQYENFGEFQFLVRAGDVLIPKINFVEPLKLECQHFADCILQHRQPLTDGNHGLKIVEILEAAQASMNQNHSTSGER